jgi:ATP-dependent Lon protease
MTGEISTLGEVISVGGIREKLTACKNHKINTVIVPFSNEKNFNKLPDQFKAGFKIYFVKNIDEVYRIAFTDEDLSDIRCVEVPDDLTLEIPMIDEPGNIENELF